MKPDFPFPYYFYGSHDSQDTDVIIEIPSLLMPVTQEERKQLMKRIEKEWELDWNANLIVVEDGRISNTIFPKSWIDSLNNSLFTTYDLHKSKQVHSLSITGLVERNKLLAIYKALRTILTMLTRTDYRRVIKPIIKGIHPFRQKIDALKQVDFTSIYQFNQDNTSDVDVWKIIGFYLGQNISLVCDGIEIYTKADLVKHHPDLKPFVYREPITAPHKELLNTLIKKYLDEIIIPYGEYICIGQIMECNGEKIDMKDEVFL